MACFLIEIITISLTIFNTNQLLIILWIRLQHTYLNIKIFNNMLHKDNFRFMFQEYIDILFLHQFSFINKILCTYFASLGNINFISPITMQRRSFATNLIFQISTLHYCCAETCLTLLREFVL